MFRINFLGLLITLLFLSFQSGLSQEWVECNLPSDTTILHKMCHFNETFWAVDYGSGAIYKSLDRAQNWKRIYQTAGEYLEAIQFLDKSTGYLCGDYGIIMKTTDGGTSWIEIGPEYNNRVTRKSSLEDNPKALSRNYYKMFFKNKNEGLIWGFETTGGDYRSFKPFFIKTIDGGNSWQRLNYDRSENGADSKIIVKFLDGHLKDEEQAMELYFNNNLLYELGHKAVFTFSKDKEWSTQSLPQLPEKRRMLRTIHFINPHQGYIFGGDLKEESSAYIMETLDGGLSWTLLETELPHIHSSLQNDNEILLSCKEGILIKWLIEEKSEKSVIHSGSTSRIMIDGKSGDNEWEGANMTSIEKGLNLYSLQDENYLYLALSYDTTLLKNYYVDLFLALESDTILNLHASQQLGERILIGESWDDNNPHFNWGIISDWTANTIGFDKKSKSYLSYELIEFQIAKQKIPDNEIKLSINTRDINWNNNPIQFPPLKNAQEKIVWKLFHLD